MDATDRREVGDALRWDHPRLRCGVDPNGFGVGGSKVGPLGEPTFLFGLEQALFVCAGHFFDWRRI